MACVAALLQRHDVARGELSTRILSSGSAAQALLSAAMRSVIALHTEIAPAEVKLVRKLGEGSDASVWAGEWYTSTPGSLRVRIRILELVNDSGTVVGVGFRVS